MPLNYVDIDGVLEVRTLVDDPDGGEEAVVDRHYEPPVDMIQFQEEFRYDKLPENFCQKDRYTASQKIFYCLVCLVDLKSPPTLDSHVKGTKHAKKVLEHKRRRSGIAEDDDPVGKPAKKKERKPAKLHGVNIAKFGDKTLKEHLEDAEHAPMPALGLEFVEEYLGERPRDPRQYTCTLDGCKSAWGDSFSMAKHLCGHKHNKNYLLHVSKIPEDDLMTKNQILNKAEEYDSQYRQPGEPRDYDIIKQSHDQERYFELKNRRPDWSEAKAKLEEKRTGGGGRAGHKRTGSPNNANMIPLGKRPRDDDSPEPRQPSRRSPSREERRRQRERDAEERKKTRRRDAELMIEKLDGLHVRIEKNLDLVRRGEGDELRELTTEMVRQYRFMVEFFGETPNSTLVEKEYASVAAGVHALQERHDLTMDGGRSRLTVLKATFVELQACVGNFFGSSSDAEYGRLSSAIRSLEADLRKFDPSDEGVSLGKAALVQDCSALAEDLGKRGESLSSQLEQQRSLTPAAPAPAPPARVPSSPQAPPPVIAIDSPRQSNVSQQQQQQQQQVPSDEKTLALNEYKRELYAFCSSSLAPYLPYDANGVRASNPDNVRLKNEAELSRHAAKIAAIVLKKEQQMWGLQKYPWSKFKFTEGTRNKTLDYIKKRMAVVPVVKDF